MGLREVIFTAALISLFSSFSFAENLTANQLSTLKPFHGETRGPEKPVRLLYIWASWCPDCKAKLRADISDLVSEYKEARIDTVNMDSSADRARGFIRDESLSLPVFRDEKRLMTKELNLYAVPAWVVLKFKETKWEVIAKSTGSDISSIKKALNKALGDKK